MSLTTTQFIIICAVVLFVVILIIFPSFRKQLKSLIGGFLQIFIQDKAKTPEGARAIYAQQIDEYRDRYSRACDSLADWTGKYKTAKDSYERYKKDVSTFDEKARAAIARGDMESAKTFARRRQESLDQCENLKAQLDELGPLLEEAKTIKQNLEDCLIKLEREAKNTVSELELANQMKDIYKDFDELRAESGTDKLVKAAREGVRESKEKAAGAKMNYQSSRKGMETKANAKAADYEIQAYLDSITKGTGAQSASNKQIKK